MSTPQEYGRFIEEDACFELTQEPPRKWINLHYNQIGENEMYAETSNIGDGPVWVRDDRGRKCMLVSYDSKYLYIRDEESGTVFCPWGAPAPQEVSNRSARFWAAKTEISGTCDGLRATQRVFVPRQHLLEAWTLTLENLTDRPKKVSVFAYAMFQLTGCDEEGRSIGKDNYAEVHPEMGGVFITNRNSFVPTDRFKGYLVTLADFAGGTGYRDHFTRSEFSMGTPKILWGWNADNKPGFGPDCCGLVQVALRIPPKQTGRADFLLGQAASVAEVEQIRSGITPEGLDEMCAEQMEIESRRSEAFRVQTGNEGYDALMNHFVKKQLYSYLINKSGFRDNLQVDNAICLFDCSTAEDNLLRALASQYPTGSVPHGFRPLNRLQYSDKPAWTMLTIPGVIEESGDLSLLDKPVPFFESDQTGSVWEHMLRAMRFLSEDLGAHGLCNQHHADWNDGLEATEEAGERESVMVTEQLCYGLRKVEMLAERIGDSAVAAEARQRYADFAAKLNDVAWDGQWYVRTICGDGYRIGSKDNREGKIFLNPQSWAILSGIAPADRAAACMKSVDEHIEEDVGYRICNPPFTEYDPRVGRMSNSMPGHVENGGCYCHAAGFKGVADCALGRPEEAWKTFVKTAPDSPLNPISQSHIEPFSFTNSYSTVPWVYGKSGYPWRTGTAGWFTVLLIEWILGARRSLDGLVIDPCLSKSIEHASIARTFRGARYEITLDNSKGRCRGATSIHLDGQKIEGNVLPVLTEGTHAVEVVV
jgi:glucosylgalactose phosphorylase